MNDHYTDAQIAAMSPMQGHAGTTVTISIGRNWGQAAHQAARGTTMNDLMWGHFQRSIDNTLARYDAHIHVDSAKSSGQWQGQTEETATWVAELPWSSMYPESTIEPLRTDLQMTARLFLQDAIAFTVGQTELIEAYHA